MLTRIEALLLTTWMTWKEPWRTRVSIPNMTGSKRPQVTPTMRCTSGKRNIWWNAGLTTPPWYICIGLSPWTPNRRWVRCCQQVWQMLQHRCFVVQHAMTSLARCYLLMGYWEYATIAADVALAADKYFVKAIYAKAEALYNTCQFEQALVLFHQGKVIVYVA